MLKVEENVMTKQKIHPADLPVHIQPYISKENDSVKVMVPDSFNLGSAVTDWVLNQWNVFHDKDAFIVETENLGVTRLTYGELHYFSNQFGHLLAESGIDSGSRVMIKLPNCIEYPIAFLGTIKAGFIATPISTMLTSAETEFIVNDNQASVLITSAYEAEKLDPELRNRFSLIILVDEHSEFLEKEHIIYFWEALKKCKDTPIKAKSNSNDPAYLVYTSGTTGNPKGVLHAQRSLLGRLPAALAWFDFKNPQRIMHTGKMNWTYVLGTAMMDPLFHGHTVVAYEGKNEPAKWLQLAGKYNCTTFIAVPTIYRQILQKTRAGKSAAPSLEHCMSAGEKLSEQVLSEFHERFHIYIHEGLGMSEVSYYLSQPPGDELRPGATGKIQPGHMVKLLDENQKPVKPGDEGMIAIHRDDPGLFLSYWNRPEEENQVIRGEWFMTGDYAIEDPDGYVFFLGRRDDIINTFGFRVSPYEIEKVLKDHEAVADGVVVGEVLSEEKTLLSAVIVLHKGASVSEKEIIEFLAKKVATYKVPKKVTFLESLPRTRNGKILRSEILKILKERS